MSSMETFILVVACICAGLGAMVLLSCLAGKRAYLIKSYNIKQEIAARDQLIHEKNRQEDAPDNNEIKTVAGA